MSWIVTRVIYWKRNPTVFLFLFPFQTKKLFRKIAIRNNFLKVKILSIFFWTLSLLTGNYQSNLFGNFSITNDAWKTNSTPFFFICISLILYFAFSFFISIFGFIYPQIHERKHRNQKQFYAWKTILTQRNDLSIIFAIVSRLSYTLRILTFHFHFSH